MPRYILDTNKCIYLMKNQPEEVARRFAECRLGDVAMSAVPEREEANLAALIEDIPVMPFDSAAGVAYGPIRKATRSRKRDHLDKLIAAHATALGATLVTNNVEDFTKYPNVMIENWIDEDEGMG